MNSPMTEEESIKEREFRLYKFLRHAAQNDALLINEEGWKKVEAEMAMLHPHLGQKLYAYGIHLTDIQMRVCWMARLRIPPKEMSIILKLTKQGVSNIRSRLYQKFLGKKGNGLMFDEFVRSL